MTEEEHALVIILMGVSGSGKTTVAQHLTQYDATCTVSHSRLSGTQGAAEWAESCDDVDELTHRTGS